MLPDATDTRPLDASKLFCAVVVVVHFGLLMSRYGACTADSTLECPLDYTSGVGEAFGPAGTELSNEACAADTLETANWQVEVSTAK